MDTTLHGQKKRWANKKGGSTQRAFSIRAVSKGREGMATQAVQWQGTAHGEQHHACALKCPTRH